MNVRIRWNSVLPVILPFFLAAALTLSVRLAAVGQDRPPKESTSSKNVEQAVSKLLSVPVYTASNERFLNEAGDGAAVAITRIVCNHNANRID